MPTLTYSQLIEKTISDFDSIFSALSAKSVSYNGNILGSSGYTVHDGIKTEEYAGLITNQLFKVNNKPQNMGNNTVINYRSSTGVTNATYKDGVSTDLVISGKISTFGLYDENSEISINAQSVNLSNSNLTKNGNHYIYRPTTGVSPIGSVEIDEGHLSLQTINQNDINLQHQISIGMENTNIAVNQNNGIYPDTETFKIPLNLNERVSISNKPINGNSLNFNSGYVKEIQIFNGIGESITKETTPNYVVEVPINKTKTVLIGSNDNTADWEVANTVQLGIQNTYNKDNVTISIGNNVIGENVSNDLDRLMKRMNGIK